MQSRIKRKVNTPMKDDLIDPHQWTNGAEYVLMVKCLNADGTGNKGFVWPKAGPVKNDKWSRTPDCESGGLFGWAWGLGISDGKEPNATHPWLVFRAKPENIGGKIEGGLKCKAVPGENGDLPEVVYYGNMAGAMAFTMQGRVALVQKNSKGSASATGERGVAVATGEYSAIEVNELGTGICTAERWYWKVQKGAFVVCRWENKVTVLSATHLKLKPEMLVKIQRGKIVKEFTCK